MQVFSYTRKWCIFRIARSGIYKSGGKQFVVLTRKKVQRKWKCKRKMKMNRSVQHFSCRSFYYFTFPWGKKMHLIVADPRTVRCSHAYSYAARGRPREDVGWLAEGGKSCVGSFQDFGADRARGRMENNVKKIDGWETVAVGVTKIMTFIPSLLRRPLRVLGLLLLSSMLQFLLWQDLNIWSAWVRILKKMWIYWQRLLCLAASLRQHPKPGKQPTQQVRPLRIQEPRNKWGGSCIPTQVRPRRSRDRTQGGLILEEWQVLWIQETVDPRLGIGDNGRRKGMGEYEWRWGERMRARVGNYIGRAFLSLMTKSSSK